MSADIFHKLPCLPATFASRSLVLVVASLLAGIPAVAANPAPTTTTTLAITVAGSAVATVPSGTAVTFTATVIGGTTPIPRGQVNFCDATASSCTDIHLLATAQITTAGTATIKLIPAIGSQSYKAVFVGTKSYATSSSSTSNLTVTGATAVSYPTTTTLVSSNGSVGYSLNATVVGSGTLASPAPSGTVSFLDTTAGNSVLGTAELAAGTPLRTLVDGSTKFASLPGGEGPIASADFNGDGKPDLAVAAGFQVTPFLGNGDASFTAAAPLNGQLNAYPSAIAAADFNADGKTDLVVAAGPETGTSGFILVFLGNGDGTFAAAKTYTMPSAYPSAIAIGDFNQDGIPDVAALTNSSGSDGNISILLGNGDGTFTPAASQPSVVSVAALAVGDFNGDGNADMAVVVNNPSGVSGLASFTTTVLLGNGDGTFTAAAASNSLCCGASLIVAGDFNGDGKADLAIADAGYSGTTPTGPAVTVMLGNGDGTFAADPPQVSLGAGTAAITSISIGDFNGDGNADLAATTPNGLATTGPSVLLGTGSGTFTLGLGAGEFSEGGYMAVADFNGGGASDIAIPDPAFGWIDILVLQQQQTSTASATGISPIGSGTHQIVASYPGDSHYTSSISQAVALTATGPLTNFYVPTHTYGDPPFAVAATTVSPGALTYSVVSGPASLSGTTVTLTGVGSVTLQVSQAAAGNYPAASLRAVFTVNQAVLTVTANNAARVFGAPNPTFTGTIVGAAYGDTFTETFATTATVASIVGSYPIVPSVTGTNLADYDVSPMGGTLTVSQAGTVTTFALSNQNTTLTATVAPLTSGLPTGTVAFYEGQTLVGTGPLTNGVASVTTSSFPSGDVVVSAQYSGDANFTQSASPPILVLALAPANTSLTVPATGSVTDSLTISPAPGYTGTVQLSCAGLPAGATCTFQPASVAFTASSGKTNVSLTIQTGVTTQAALPAQNSPGSMATQIAAVLWAPGLFATLLAGRRRKQATGRPLVVLALLGGVLATLSACGGGSSMTTTSNGTTAAGTYNVQINAAGPNNLTQSTTISLVVQ